MNLHRINFYNKDIYTPETECFNILIKDYFSQCETWDLRIMLKTSAVNKFFYEQSYLSGIWFKIQKIYNSEKDHTSRRDLLSRIFTDITNVCLPENCTLNNTNYSLVSKSGCYHFQNPKKLGISQISFIHAAARSIYEHKIWLNVEDKLEKKRTLELKLTKKINIKREDLLFLSKSERNLLINDPLKALEKDEFGTYKNIKLADLYNRIYHSSIMIDEWIKKNKYLFPLIESVKYASENPCTDISAIPVDFFSLVTLKKASFENNCIKHLQPEMKKLTQLEYISLKRNLLHNFPKVLLKIPSLTNINLSNNHISSIPDISILKKLKKLTLSDNEITSLDKSISKLSLKTLNLKKNPIHINVIPKSLKGVKILLSESSKLNLDIPSDFKYNLVENHMAMAEAWNLPSYPVLYPITHQPSNPVVIDTPFPSMIDNPFQTSWVYPAGISQNNKQSYPFSDGNPFQPSWVYPEGISQNNKRSYPFNDDDDQVDVKRSRY